jgi:putative SOS response-associated peptidase YedK
MREICMSSLKTSLALTCQMRTILSYSAGNELVAQIHTPRMPLRLPEEDHAKWLGEAEDGDLKALLKPFPAGQMRIWVISP